MTTAERIRADVDRLMSQNRQARTQYPGEWWRLLAITRGRLNQLNHSGIALGRWLAEHAGVIEAHHAALGIEDPTRHNFKAWCHQRTMNGRSAGASLKSVTSSSNLSLSRFLLGQLEPSGLERGMPATPDVSDDEARGL